MIVISIDIIRAILTLLTMIAFFGICWHIFVRHSAKDFDEAAASPLEDNQPGDGLEQKTMQINSSLISTTQEDTARKNHQQASINQL